jgi:hypothetical protein
VTAFIGDLTKQDSLFVIVATPGTPVKRRVTGSGWQVDVVTHSQSIRETDCWAKNEKPSL